MIEIEHFTLDRAALGQNIRSLRKQHQYTQQDIADVCHVSLETIKKWEQGNRAPGLEALIDLSRIFHTSVESILQLDSPSCQEGQHDISISSINHHSQDPIPDYFRIESSTGGHHDSMPSDLKCTKDNKPSPSSKLSKPGTILLIGGLLTMLIICITIIIGMVHLQNMAQDTYYNTEIETFIEEYEVIPDNDLDQ